MVSLSHGTGTGRIGVGCGAEGEAGAMVVDGNVGLLPVLTSTRVLPILYLEVPNMKMSEEVKKAIAECGPALVATASKSGKPNVSAKGSLRVLDDEHLVFADTRSPRTIANLRENPQVGIICLNAATRKGCRVWGRAEVLSSGELFDKIAKEVAARNMKLNNVIKITVEEAVAF